MLSNLMPGSNHEALNPPDHLPGCRVTCEFADQPLEEGTECGWGHDHHECTCEDAAQDLALLGAED